MLIQELDNKIGRHVSTYTIGTVTGELYYGLRGKLRKEGEHYIVRNMGGWCEIFPELVCIIDGTKIISRVKGG